MRQKRDLILILRKVIFLTGISNNKHIQLLVKTMAKRNWYAQTEDIGSWYEKVYAKLRAGWLRQIGLTPPTACSYTTLGVTSRSQLLLRDKSRNIIERVNHAASNFFSE